MVLNLCVRETRVSSDHDFFVWFFRTSQHFLAVRSIGATSRYPNLSLAAESAAGEFHSFKIAKALASLSRERRSRSTRAPLDARPTHVVTKGTHSPILGP